MNGPTVTPVSPVTTPPESPVDVLLRSLEPHRVIVTRSDEVRAYLDKYPDIIPHILPTVERARQEFGQQAELLMTINDDPEIYDPFVVLTIRLPKYGPDTRPRLDKVSEPLWEDELCDLKGQILVTTDYRVIGG
jgi:hypothetical protein